MVRLSVVIALLAVSVMGSMEAGAQAAGDAVSGQYLIELRPGATANLVAARHGLGVKFMYRRAANGIAASVAPGRLRALQNDADVVSVVPDRVMTVFAKPGSGTPAPAGQTVPAGVERIGAAPGSLSMTGAGVGVAIADTGLDFNHADLQPVGSASFSAFGGTGLDDHGHGTHCGGIVAARNNTVDVVGVAPAATLYAVKVLNRSGSGSDSDIIAGLDWIAQNASAVSPPIRVVNMSLGRPGTLNDSPLLRAAVQNLTNANISVVVSAGNNASVEVSQNVPATYPEVMAIASTTAKAGTNQSRFFSGVIEADTASYFTTDGAYSAATGIGVTVSGPGAEAENVTKAGFIESVGILSTRFGGGTTRMSGTSMSSPHVAGVVALMWQKANASSTVLTPAAIKAKLQASASAIGTAPKNSPVSSYTFDGVREGVVSGAGALTP